MFHLIRNTITLACNIKPVRKDISNKPVLCENSVLVKIYLVKLMLRGSLKIVACFVKNLHNLSLRGPKGRGNLLRYK